MLIDNFVGIDVSIYISDPWDFGSKCGVGPFKGKIRASDITGLFVILNNYVKYNDNIYDAVIIRIRHQDDKIDNILKDKKIASNMLLISTKTMDGDWIKQYDGMGVIGSIERIIAVP